MKRIQWTSLILLLLFLPLVLGACGADSSAPELLEPTTVGSDLAPVKVGDIYNGTVLEGNVLPKLEELSFSENGVVGQVCVLLGDSVKKGDPLIRLDTEALKETRETLTEELEYAKKMDDFDTRAAELNGELLAQQVGWGSSRYLLFANEQEAAAKQRAAEIAALERQLAEINENLNEESVLKAPCDGTVAALAVSVGDPVQEDEIIAAVADDSQCFLQTEYLAEAKVSLASTVYATVGGVRYSVSYLPMETKDYITKALAGETLYSSFALEGAKSDLIGQYALLYVMSSQREQVLNIPANALLRDEKGYYVYVDHDGERVRQEVEIGLKTDAQVEILSGLKEGENVYVVG